MCRYLADHDLRGFEQSSRSIRISGHVTSLRLEGAFWEVLEELAAREGLSLAQLITILDEEAVETIGGAVNLASVLRTVCLIHRRNALDRPAGPAPH